ncbi:MFS transporter [Paludibacterium paludis]|uniref:MFS transporter n=1 Tax=Paludibacterium paludis TaxID=1225769 RepID=A0A918P3Z7_9NEIS|nr:MFS transporter [Paludibacterium paludis]GGY18445.1 MFS transporter [Paludibacterium paludis]
MSASLNPAAGHAADTPSAGIRPATLLLHLALLYLAQGMYGGFLAVAVPAVVRDRGYDLNVIGLLYLSMLPWVIKFLWAPLVDRRGSRRAWILPIQGAYALMFFGLALLDGLSGPAFVQALAVILFAGSWLMSTQDIAVDGFAVENSSPRLYGAINAAQVGGASLGALIGGGFLLVLIPRWGWAAAQCLLGAAMLACLAATWRVGRLGSATAAKAHSASLRHFVRRAGAGRRLAVAALFMLAVRLAVSMIGPSLIDRGVDLATVGWLQGVAGTGASLAGALSWAWIIRRFGARAALAAACLLQAAAWIGLAWAASRPGALPLALAVPLVLILSLSVSAAFVSFYALVMGWCSPAQPGTDFTVFQSLDSALAIGGALAGATLAKLAGYPAVFAVSAALLLLGMLPVARWLRQLERLDATAVPQT